MRVTVQETRQKRNRYTSPTGYIGLLLLLITTFGFSVSFEEAVELENQGKIDEARTAYQALLENGDENFCLITSRLADITKGLQEKRRVLEQGLEKCQEPVLRHSYYIRLARLEEISGNLETAQRYYQSASLAVPKKKDFDSLLSSAILLFEIGSYRGAEAQATVIIETAKNDRLKREARVLLSRIFFATERQEKALQTASELMGEQKLELSAAGLFWIVELTGYTGEKHMFTDAADLLLSRYPDSPEAHMYRGNIGRVPSFSLFVGPGMSETTGAETGTAEMDAAAVTETTGAAPVVGAGAEEISDEAERPLAVQTGSYSVRENAEYALKDLEAEGFVAEIRERIVGGTVYYRVLIPDIAPDEVETVILNLKENGFEGFRVYE